MIWFTSDLHLGHANMIRYASRPFVDVDEMDRELVAAVNDRVACDDELWVLGDLAVRATQKELAEYRARIACRHVHLVHGNHDSHLRPGQSEGLFEHDVAYYDGMRSPAGRRLVLCHYPIMDWNGQRRGSYMLHGHIHSRGAAYNEANRASGLLRYDVGVDANGYAPISIEEVDAWFAGVDPVPAGHGAAGVAP